MSGIVAKIKDFIRKFIVSLKRNPSMIPLVVLFLSFLYYSLNLTHLSNTTAKLQGSGMGLCQFTIMLLSLLSLVCMLNSFPRRKKPNYPMIALMFVMFAVNFYCSIHYGNAITHALTRPDSPIAATESILKAQSVLVNYMIMLGVTAALVVLLPVYSKLLKKINTSIEVEDNGSLGEIEIAE